MAEERKQPELRFKGFTDDWIQDKLHELTVINSGKDYKNLSEGHIPVYGTGGYMLSVNKSLSDIDAVGLGRKGTIDNPIYLKAPFWTVDTLFYITTQQQNNIMFFYYLFKTINWKKYNEASGVPSLSKQTIYSISVKVPNTFEQSKISKLFYSLDRIITLEQQKIEKLELLKQYLLQNMFADESGYPNLRFRGYTGPWFKNKGKNIFKKITEKKQAHLPVLSATQDKGMVLRDEFNERLQYDRKNLSNYKVVRPGQFVVHLRSFQGGFAHSNYLGITSPAYTIFDFINTNEHNDIYWKFYFANDHFILLLEKVTYGIRDGRTINFSDFCTLNINFPSLSEQNKIAKLLFSLDSLINLRTTKLENLTSLKQKLLSSLFI